ncbi:LamG-like jellyroll fold domain-containing protein [Wenyingzhuangia sp. 2_MG-2023]|nr:LamG-like jellyroll fold domain-containing protein [Wenyingzhuangia sp. 2_MG-2023]MDO6737357.1 LamG-like jellyroll fold domain-containing protein [Wenyingzhuangia sp. 2_MG-2023]
MKKQLLTILACTFFAFFSKAEAQTDYKLAFNSADEQRLRYLTTEDDILETKLNGATDYTIEIWIKPTSETFHNSVILKRWNQFALTLYQDDNKRIYFTHYGASSTYVNSVNNAFILNEWNHIVVICNSATNSVKLYANGVDVTLGTQTALTLAASPSGANFYLGTTGSGGGYFTGQMDKVRIKNTAENIASLQDDITDADYVTDANTALLYNFEEGSGIVTKNEADNENGTLQCSNGTCTTQVWWVNDESLSNTIAETIDFKIYPNPVIDDVFTVQTSSDESLLKIEIFDVLSKQINSITYTENTTSASVNIADLQTGVYYVKVHTSKGMGIKSIIIK